jgi:hypothetical protein
MVHSADAVDLLRQTFAARPLAERWESLAGQWSVVQDTLEAAADPQTVANDNIQDCVTAGGVPFQLAAAPVQFGERPAAP